MTAVREHIRHGATRARIRLEVERSLRPLGVVLAGMALALSGLAYIGMHLPGRGGLASTVQLRFAVDDASGVVADRDEVRVSGIPAGTIKHVAVDHGRAVLTVEVERKYAPIYRDARAQLRPNTPIQDMYLDIVNRGTPGSGIAEAAQPLSLAQTDASVAIGDVLNTFDADTRSRLQTLLSEFGTGLDGEGATLQRAFVEVAPLLDVARRLTRQLEERRHQTRRLIDNSAVLTEELTTRQRLLRRLVTESAATLSAVQARNGSLDQTLQRLPGVLAELDTATRTLDASLPTVDRAVTSLGPVSGRLGPALESLRRLGASARPAFARLQPAVDRLSPLVTSLRPASARLASAFGALTPQTGAVDHATQSLGRCTHALQRFFQWTQSTFSMGDAFGVAPRGDASVSLDTTGLAIDRGVAKAAVCAGGTTLGGAPAEVIRP